MRKRTFRGELHAKPEPGKKLGDYVGMIHKLDDGFVVRLPSGYNGIGPIIFDGRRFGPKDFTFIRTFNVSAATTVKMYEFAAHVRT